MSADDIVLIGEVADVFDGPHATPKKIESGPYFLSISSLSKGALNLSQSAHLSDDDFKKWTKRVTPEEGDILFSYETRLGEAAIMPPGIRACLGRRMGLLRPDRSKVIPEYLLYAYLSPEFQSTIEQRKIHGATVDRIALKELPSFPILVPSLDEQRFVVDNLKALDSKIELNHQINQTLEQMAQAIFKSWFVDFEPVKAKIAALEAGGNEDDALLAAMQAISGKTPEDLTRLQAKQPEQYAELRATAELFPSAMQESELGEIPEGWNIAPISDFGKVICGKTPSKQKPGFYGENVPFIKIPDMHGNVFATHTSDHLSSAGAASQSKKTIPKGSVCVSCIATVGQVVITTEESHTNQQINSIVPFEGCYTPYLYFRMQSLYEHLHDLASGGSATLNLNTGSFSKIRILMPSKTLLDSFAKSSSALFEGSLNNVNSAQTLGSLRDILLPKLLSGELSVSDAETQLTQAEEPANV
jgi:type I restriction enzyme S subunit